MYIGERLSRIFLHMRPFCGQRGVVGNVGHGVGHGIRTNCPHSSACKHRARECCGQCGHVFLLKLKNIEYCINVQVHVTTACNPWSGINFISVTTLPTLPTKCPRPPFVGTLTTRKRIAHIAHKMTAAWPRGQCSRARSTPACVQAEGSRALWVMADCPQRRGWMRTGIICN